MHDAALAIFPIAFVCGLLYVAANVVYRGARDVRAWCARRQPNPYLAAWRDREPGAIGGGRNE